MKVLFIHEAPGQFGVLHKYLNGKGLADSWLMCSQSVYNAEKNNIPNIIPFGIPKDEEKTFFYVRKFEGRIKRSFHIRKAILDFLQNHKVDIIVTHGSGGFPLQIFDEFNIPIITYIEFPSFTMHGYDPKYPQPEYAFYIDKLFEMTSYHQVIKSDFVIVPSEYSKTMYPDYLQHKIYAQMEGFDIKRKPPNYKKKEGFHYIGYTARDLSSAKGFEQFILIAKRILEKRKDVKFIFCGSPKILYSYEGEMLQKAYGPNHKETFMSHILRREEIDLKTNDNFTHIEFSKYDDFAGFIESIDIFLYPIQFGSANWGLFELLFRGRVVIASNRCFVPEVISHGRNGFLCEYEDIDTWARVAIDVLENLKKYTHIGKNAVDDAVGRFGIDTVSKQYLSLFNLAIAQRQVKKLKKN